MRMSTSPYGKSMHCLNLMGHTSPNLRKANSRKMVWSSAGMRWLRPVSSSLQHTSCWSNLVGDPPSSVTSSGVNWPMVLFTRSLKEGLLDLDLPLANRLDLRDCLCITLGLLITSSEYFCFSSWYMASLLFRVVSRSILTSRKRGKSTLATYLLESVAAAEEGSSEWSISSARLLTLPGLLAIDPGLLGWRALGELGEDSVSLLPHRLELMVFWVSALNSPVVVKPNLLCIVRNASLISLSVQDGLITWPSWARSSREARLDVECDSSSWATRSRLERCSEQFK